MKKIRVGIVDDHEIIALGMRAWLLETGSFDVLFAETSLEGLLTCMEKNRPDVLSMDVVMPGSVAAENFKEIIKKYPDQKVMAYTALNSPAMIELLFKQGIKGYMNKNQPLNDLKTAIEEIYNDRIYLPSEYDFIRKKLKLNDHLQEELSKREIEVLQLIVREKKSNEIAELLQISVNTVESHRKHLFDKFGVTNLAGLVKAGFDRGYLQ